MLKNFKMWKTKKKNNVYKIESIANEMNTVVVLEPSSFSKININCGE